MSVPAATGDVAVSWRRSDKHVNGQAVHEFTACGLQCDRRLSIAAGVTCEAELQSYQVCHTCSTYRFCLSLVQVKKVHSFSEWLLLARWRQTGCTLRQGCMPQGTSMSHLYTRQHNADQARRQLEVLPVQHKVQILVRHREYWRQGGPQQHGSWGIQHHVCAFVSASVFLFCTMSSLHSAPYIP